jgi:ubiquinone/menaquinone biosynthesis C-methylase UbiE
LKLFRSSIDPLTPLDALETEIDKREDSTLPTFPHIGERAWLVPARVDKPELLDLGVGSPDDVRQSFADLWRINRFLGGIRALTVHLYPRLAAQEGIVSCVDIGAGSGEIASLIARWAARRGIHLRMVALDIAARNLALARERTQAASGVSLVQADVTCLPLGEESVDYVISSLFLHHFTPEQVITILRSTFACARRGIIMSDPVRGWLPALGFKLVQPVFARSFLTRYDGAASVRRAYTPAEFRQLARAAGLKNVHVHTHFPFRMTLVADK